MERMRWWWVALTCGCLSKPLPPGESPSDGSAGSGSDGSAGSGGDGMPSDCQQFVMESFDDTSRMDCGPSLMAIGGGSISRSNGQVVMHVNTAQSSGCSASAYPLGTGVFVEAYPTSLVGDGVMFLQVSSQ